MVYGKPNAIPIIIIVGSATKSLLSMLKFIIVIKFTKNTKI